MESPEPEDWWYELLDYGLTCGLYEMCWDIEKAKRKIEIGISNRVAEKMILITCQYSDYETNPELLQLLVDSSAVDVNAPIHVGDGEGRTPLVILVRYFDYEGVYTHIGMKTLHILLNAGADINVRDKNGRGTLMQFAFNCPSFHEGGLLVFKLLLENNPDMTLRSGKPDIVEALYPKWTKSESRRQMDSSESDVRKKFVEAIFEREHFRMRKVKPGTPMYQDLELLFDPQSAVILKRWLLKDKRFESEELIEEICSFVCYSCLIDAWTIPRKRKHSKIAKMRKKKKR